MARRKTRRRQPQTQKNKSILIGSFFTGIVLLVAGIFLFRAEEKAASPVALMTMAEAQTLYEANCAECHGLQGEGHVQFEAPAINGSEHAWHHADEQLIFTIRTGGVQMPPVGADFSQQEVEAIISYVKGWWTSQQRAAQPGEIGEG